MQLLYSQFVSRKKYEHPEKYNEPILIINQWDNKVCKNDDMGLSVVR